MLKTISALGALTLLVTPALADMCPETTKEKAEQAVKLIPRNVPIVEYCDRCVPKVSKSYMAAYAESEVEQGDQYKVVVNKDLAEPLEFDLGYLYVVNGPKKQYTNLGWLIKCRDEYGGDSDFEYKVLPANKLPKLKDLPPVARKPG
jgi:hypothetical protein